MATATLVFVGNRRLRYLISSDRPATVVIPSNGGASPDLFSDSLAGPLKQLARAPRDGYQMYGPGALTSEQAQTLWLSLARQRVTIRAGAPSVEIDVDVDNGYPRLLVTLTRGEIYLDVEV